LCKKVGHKQYYVTYDSDRLVCGSNNHDAGNASTLKSAKQIIRNIRITKSEYNPYNFKVFDCWADVDPKTQHVPCVYQEY